MWLRLAQRYWGDVCIVLKTSPKSATKMTGGRMNGQWEVYHDFKLTALWADYHDTESNGITKLSVCCYLNRNARLDFIINASKVKFCESMPFSWNVMECDSDVWRFNDTQQKLENKCNYCSFTLDIVFLLSFNTDKGF